MPRITRRRFLQSSAVALAGPTIISATALGAEGRPAASERITMGCIGLGGEGLGKNTRAFCSQGDAQVVAVCDVDGNHLAEGKKVVEAAYAAASKAGTYKGCDTTKDFRDIIGRKDIDGVMISTPDHWHVPIAAAAIRAGKDVICEKPTLTIREGQELSKLVRRYGAVFQWSTEDRAMPCHHHMAELVRNGRIGKLQRIHVGLPGGPGNAGDPTPKPVPPELDYDRWLGPAPEAPYCPGRVHFNFRWITDYSGGILTDWGAHLYDTAHWANNTEHTGPTEVWGEGKRHTGGLYDTFYEYELHYKYANGVEMIVKSPNVSLRFEGTDGWVGNNGWLGKVEASSKEILEWRPGANDVNLYTNPKGEHREFLDCVKTRRDPYFPVEIGHRCFSAIHLGNIALWRGEKIRWDAEKEVCIDNAGANRYLARAMREPWGI